MEFGYREESWNGKLLSQHLEDRYAVPISVRQCQRLLHDRAERPTASE